MDGQLPLCRCPVTEGRRTSPYRCCLPAQRSDGEHPEDTSLNIFRGTAIFLTQFLLVIFLGGKYDLIFGFNRMDSGFALLLFLFMVTPLLNLVWFFAEILRSIRFAGRQSRARTLLMPLAAVLVFAEAVLVDLYIASHARM